MKHPNTIRRKLRRVFSCHSTPQRRKFANAVLWSLAVIVPGFVLLIRAVGAGPVAHDQQIYAAPACERVSEESHE